MNTLLVTGIDTIVGGNLAARLSERTTVIGHAGRALSHAPTPCITLRDDRPETLAEWIREHRPDAIVHTGAWSTAPWDLADDFLTEDELDRLAAICAAAEEVGARVTLISTAAVFVGPALFQSEMDVPKGASEFADRVSELEQAALASGALVVRTDCYGFAPAGSSKGFAERLWDAIENGQAIQADGLRHGTPILATDVADLLWSAWERNLEGLIHLCGSERVSPYQFACELGTLLAARVRPFGEDHAVTDLAGETSLCTGRARRELGQAMPMLRDGLQRFIDQAATQRERLQGKPSTIPAPHMSMSNFTAARSG